MVIRPTCMGCVSRARRTLWGRSDGSPSSDVRRPSKRSEERRSVGRRRSSEAHLGSECIPGKREVVSVRGPMEADPPRGAVPRVVGYPVAQKTIVVLEADARGLEALTEPAWTLTT